MKPPELILTAFLEPSRNASLLVWRLSRDALARACADQARFDPGARIESLLLDPAPEAAHPGREALERLAIAALLEEPSDISLGQLANEPLEAGSALLRRQSSLGFPGEAPLDAQMGFIDLLIHNPDQKANAERVAACQARIPQAIARVISGFSRLGPGSCVYLGALHPDQWDDYKERARLIQTLSEREALESAAGQPEAEDGKSGSRRL